MKDAFLADDLCGAPGISELELGDELESGLSLAYAATKRGSLMFAGFGGAETWVRAWDALRLHATCRGARGPA